MKNLYIFFFCFLVSQLVIGQSWSYVNTEEYFAMANDLYEDIDGNMLVCGGGFSWPLATGDPARVIKLDRFRNPFMGNRDCWRFGYRGYNRK